MYNDWRLKLTWSKQHMDLSRTAKIKLDILLIGNQKITRYNPIFLGKPTK